MILQTLITILTLSTASATGLTVRPDPSAAWPSRSGAIIRVVIFHRDGFGDLHNAIALARQLGARFPNAEFPVVVEDDWAFARLGSIHGGASTDADRADVAGVPVFRGASETGHRELARHEFQIILLPAGNPRTRMVWGSGRFNLYVEEPGVPESEMAYVAVPRGQLVVRPDQSHHLRINPGFGSFSAGMAPSIRGRRVGREGREELLDRLRGEGLVIDPQMARAHWGAAYNHAQYGNNAHVYLESIALSLSIGTLREHAVVFDFGRADVDRSYLRPYLEIRRRFKKSHVPLQVIRPHAPPERWIGWSASKSLTIVEVGSVDHDSYLALVNEVDLPVAVTGTQSLVEAIENDRIFSYEFIAWKMDLNFGIAEVILDHFRGTEREFLVDWILGEGDTMLTHEDLARSRERFQTAEVGRGEDEMLRHRRAVYDLMFYPERRELVRRLNALLRGRFIFGDHLEDCARRLVLGSER